MKNIRTLFCIFGILLLLSLPVRAQKQDRLLGILRGELRYSMEQLQKQEVRPYYISMRVTDQFKSAVSSSFGTTLSSTDTHTRIFVPQVRVGDRTLDNYKFTTQGMPAQKGKGERFMTLPFDDDAADGIRAGIREETQFRYDMAVSLYGQTRSKVTTSAAQEDKADCFSDAGAEKYYEDPVPEPRLRIDRERWEKQLNEVSAVFRACPELKTGSASVDYDVTRVYFVNTDGTEVVQNRIAVRVMLQVSMLTEDGMELPLMQDFFAFNVDSLPATAVMVAAARDLLERVRALKAAPVANPYTGPAILSGPASGVFFHEIFGHRLEGHRLKEGGETFKDMVGKPVLPKEFQVYCDPTLRKYAGQDLNGHYLYDSEGVRARRVDNVVNGELREFLMSRVPLDGFPRSNGHGRCDAAKDPVSRQSNLVVETVKPCTDAELRRMLTDEAKRQGKEYGYYFRTVTSGYTTTGQGGSLNSFSVTPVEVYRVYADGRPDELVRGVELIGTALSMFSHITAGGGTPATFTGFCGAESGWVPVTASSPAIFVSQIETQRHQKTQNIPPLLAPPAFNGASAGAASTDDIIFSAMRDELKRTTDSLQTAGAPRPFWASYITNRHRRFEIVGELGGISRSEISPWAVNGAVQVPVGSFRRNSDVKGFPNAFGGAVSASPDYAATRRFYWSLSDVAYKLSVNTYARKMTYLRDNPLPKALEEIPDMQRVIAVESRTDRKEEYVIDEQRLEGIARELSAVFLGYPELTGTTVTLGGTVMDTYRCTSEGVNIKQPQDFVTIKVTAAFRDDDNIMMKDNMTLVYATPADLPPTEELKGRVRKFADDLTALRRAPHLDGWYKGPVMFEGKMSFLAFRNNLLQPGQLLAVQNNLQQSANALGQRIGKTVIDPRISIVNYSDRQEYKGERLMGCYTMDADGMRPSPETVLVEKGILRKLLNRTTPAEYAEMSTGSGRFGNSVANPFPVAGFGTLHVKTEGVTNADRMEKELCRLARKKQEYVYVISIPADCDLPRLYRLDVKTGERVLMKTDKIKLPSLQQMEKLGAVSARENVMNDVTGYNHSFIYPSLFILEEFDLEKPVLKGTKAPALEYPLQRK